MSINRNPNPIRILHVVTYMGRGGLETMIMNYYRHMDRERVQFDFLTHRDFRADYDDEIESLGGKIYHIPRLVPWSRNYHKALNIFFEEHPEYKIVHVHQDCLSSVILKVAKKHGVTVRIAHSHSSSQDKDLKYVIKLLYRKQISKYATQLFACGKEAGDWMFCGAPYRIINNAIDTQLYTYDKKKRERVRKQFHIAEDVFVIGHVGRFNAVKNHVFLIDVFARIREIKRDTILLLVGDGDLHKDIENRVNELGLSGSVIFTGVRSDVYAMLQAMDCFVFPSLYEGVPVTLIEAQASGLPCFVSDGVPMECDKTGLVKQTSLSTSIDGWVKKILKCVNTDRRDTHNEIVESGYDIVANACWLQEYYLDQWEKEE